MDRVRRWRPRLFGARRSLAVLGGSALVVTAPLAIHLAGLQAAPAAGRVSPLSSPTAVPFDGTPAVGALFVKVGGKLVHFCTASVVQSPQGDLVLTAAHCLEVFTPGEDDMTFAPGYHDGQFPYGQWAVTSDFTDSAWKKNQNPNDDFAFLVVGRDGRQVEKHTGAEVLQTNTALPVSVQVIGYPDGKAKPVECTNQATLLHKQGLHQLVFDCDGYTDGTSGGPFLINVSQSTGTGDVIGAIGGYQQGGDTPNVSYSAEFLNNIAALYATATAGTSGS